VQGKTDVKGGGFQIQHNEAQVRPVGLRVQTNVKAGGSNPNHNEAQVRSLKVQTDVKGGAVPSDSGSGGQPGLAAPGAVK